jgi:hypothetical protein
VGFSVLAQIGAVHPAPAEAALAPLDWIRLRLLRATMPLSSYFVGRRAERIALLGVVSILLALVGTAALPLWMLALGPIVLGVPHVLADVRYCVVRPGWHRRPALWVGVALPLLAVALLNQPALGFAAVAGACAASDGPARRRVLGIAVAGAGATACVLTGATATLILVHLHNVVAVLLWWRWRGDDARLRALPVAAFVFGSLLIASGGLDHGFGGLARVGPLGEDLDIYLGSLAPGLEGALGLRLVLLYCFAQAVHYVIWLRLVPEDDRDRPSTRSFRASWRALVAELGLPALVITAALALGLAAWAVSDLAAARVGYLRAVGFHVFLELAVLASLWVSGRGFMIPAREASR